MRSFFQLMTVFMLFALGGCGMPGPVQEWQETNEHIDISEDLYHRMQAGLFVPAKEPLPLVLLGGDPKSHMGPVAGQYLKLSWEQGSFWVKSNEKGHVVFYMNNEAAFSHLHIGPSKAGALLVQRDFIENPVHPIWPEITFAK